MAKSKNTFEKFLGIEDRTHKAILDYLKLQYPKAIVAHPANEGKRTPFEQFKIKWLGISPGLPDILVFTPSNGYHGLVIEVKAKGKVPTREQKQWLYDLQLCGWQSTWVDNLDDGITCINEYFQPKPKQPVFYAER